MNLIATGVTKAAAKEAGEALKKESDRFLIAVFGELPELLARCWRCRSISVCIATSLR
jgi:hypothetical protein